MKAGLIAVLALHCWVGVMSAVEIGLFSTGGEGVTYDAALVVLTGEVSDVAQQSFLARFAQSEQLAYVERVQQGRKKEQGDCWLPETPSRLVTWLTLKDVQKKNTAEALDCVRTSVGKRLQSLASGDFASAVVILPQGLEVLCGGWSVVLRECAVAAQLATHVFSYSTKPQKKGLQRIDFALPDGAGHDIALAWGSAIGYYTNLARRWGEEPAGTLQPQVWAQQASVEAGRVGCACTILDAERIRTLGMGGVLAVGSGSRHAPVVIVLEYAPANPIATIALVGKGIIFDSGGLQIKSAGGMLQMKYDKCGGAAALATCLAAAALKASVRVVAVVPAVYNKTGGDAMHPRDILHMMNGKTVEVGNTDAEGRLILADGLYYVEKFYNPDVVIDIATLTGACVVALGGEYAGMMSRHDRLKKDLVAAGQMTGDRVWELPLERSYIPGNDAELADLSNCPRGSYGAGAILAGLFLENFVQNSCWAHLDIAGPAMQPPTSWFGSSGATGAGVRLLTEYITNYRHD